MRTLASNMLRASLFVVGDGPDTLRMHACRVAVTIKNFRHTRAGDLSITLQRPVDNANIVYLLNRRGLGTAGLGRRSIRLALFSVTTIDLRTRGDSLFPLC